MINSVTVINDLGEKIEMGIGKPDKSGLLISNIDGIDPATATINTTETATIDGSEYNSARFPDRLITISLYYNQNIFREYKSIEDLRHLSYHYFPLKMPVKLIFNTDNRILWIDGYVESDSVNIFSELEEVSISIKCPDPYFRKVDGTQTYSVSPTIDMFEFPFSNESLLSPMLIMSEINENNVGRFFYDGEVDTGCIIRLTFDDYVHDLIIFNQSSNEEMHVDTGKIYDLTVPKIIGHLSGIEDNLGEYIWDENGNVLEGYLQDGLSNVYGVLTGLGSSYGPFITDDKGVTIEAFYPEVYIGDGSNVSTAIPKKTILVPIDDSNDLQMTGYHSDKKSIEFIEAEVYPGIRPGDELVINTIKGKKSATLIRNGIEFNVLSAIRQKNSKWIQVVRGYNYVGAKAYYGSEGIHVEYTYDPLYAGV